MVRQQLYSQEVVYPDFAVVRMLADKWTVRLLFALSVSSRFRQLQRSLGISSKTLSNRLKRLEAHKIISRTIYAEIPVRIEYELTAKGHKLKELLQEIARL